MGTPQVEQPKPYADGTCWYGIPTNQKGLSQPCGLDARKYSLDRKCSSHGSTQSVACIVWLCLNHKDSMESQGFICTLTP